MNPDAETLNEFDMIEDFEVEQCHRDSMLNNLNSPSKSTFRECSPNDSSSDSDEGSELSGDENTDDANLDETLEGMKDRLTKKVQEVVQSSPGSKRQSTPALSTASKACQAILMPPKRPRRLVRARRTAYQHRELIRRTDNSDALRALRLQ